jgi:hypothetical protein
MDIYLKFKGYHKIHKGHSDKIKFDIIMFVRKLHMAETDVKSTPG